MATTCLTFLGTAAVLPGAGEDTAHFLVNGRLLIDTGWSCPLRMQQFGYDPMAVETLFFTHCHHDHYLGLPGLLFFRAMRRRRGAVGPRLRLVGPPDDLPRVVELARALLQPERFPEVCDDYELVPLPPGESLELDGFRLETIPAIHPVTASSFRLTDRASGVVIVGSGDTAPNPALIALARDCDLLIHEASRPPEAEPGRAGHSRAEDAARIAAEAGARRLRLVQLTAGHAERSLAAARARFPAAALATEGESLLLER